MITKIKLKDGIKLIIDNRGKTPKKLNGEFVDNGYKVISALNVHNGSIDNQEQIRYVNEELYFKWQQIPIERNDCFIASEGASLGENAIWDSDEKIVLGQRLYALRLNINIIDPWYFALYMQTSLFKEQIFNVSTGSTVFGISQPVLLNIKIFIPDIQTQRKIGILYKNLYRQLKRNDEMVQKLQVLAHTTFDYFSKNNTKNNYVVLNDILIEKDKSKIQVSDVQNASGFIPFFTSGEAVLYTNEKLETGFNIFLSTGGNAKVQSYYGDVAYSTDTWCITAKNNLQFYLFGYLKHIESQMDKLYFHGTGLKHLQKPIFLKSIISIPNQDLLMKYNTIVEPIYHQISKIEQSTIQLQCLKNKLLPFLINQQLA